MKDVTKEDIQKYVKDKEIVFAAQILALRTKEVSSSAYKGDPIITLAMQRLNDRISELNEKFMSEKITADIFNDGFGVTFVGFGIDIETVFMFPVAESLALFERGADPVFHFIKEGGAEGVTKESIVEVADITPEAIVTVTTFRNEAMDVGVPFQISAKGMKDHDKTGSKIQGFILFEKHAGNNTVDSVEEAVEQCPVIKEEPAEVFVNGKDTMLVDNVYQLEGHGGGTLHGVEVSAGRAEAAVAPEGDKFQFAAFGAAEHCPAKGGIATIDHFIDIFHHSFSWVESIYNFFIMVCKNSLKDIHKTIMKENSTKRNP